MNPEVPGSLTAAPVFAAAENEPDSTSKTI
jgi:hypothetical protein